VPCFDAIGAERCCSQLVQQELDRLRENVDRILTSSRPGARVFADLAIGPTLQSHGAIGRVAASRLGARAEPVRLVVFDKNAQNNWVVGWHQDRTIAVREPRVVEGFGPWSMKAGAHHVQPPFELLARMVTLRIHLDDCGDGNAPLLVAPGSHRLGYVPANRVADTALRLGSLACTARAGDIWVYSTPILHASERSRDPSARRRVLHVDYSADPLPHGLEWLGIGCAPS
jgi:hypothetical protein